MTMTGSTEMLPNFENKIQPQQLFEQLQKNTFKSNRWFLVLKRMAETRVPARLFHTLAINAFRRNKKFSTSPSFQRSTFASWMTENIQKKECCFYEKDDKENDSVDTCKCGYPKNEHVPEAIKSEDFAGETWDKHRHIHEVPTDAFGDISFGGLGLKTGKYCRVSTDTSPEILYKLLTEQWKLSPPNLLISVTGGAKNFSLKARLKNTFNRGLMKVAQTTGAWIITGGTNAGVMKHVGQAVRDYALSSSMQGQIVAIGVATWGVIHNRDALVYSEGCFPAHYSMDTKDQGQFSCLDNNHTHFLLVDNGTQGRYGVEIELRTRLEKCVSRKHLGNKGSDHLQRHPEWYAMCGLGGLWENSRCDCPGGGLPVSQVTIKLIHQLMKKFFGQEYETFQDDTIIKWTKTIQDIIRMSHLLTIFRVGPDNQGDVDVAILQALLKASRTSESLGIERQLQLAIAWNRADIAETEIFTEDSQWKATDLHKAMFSALVGNKPEFVSLLLENGVSLRDFLQNEDTLCDLYKQLPNCFFLHKLARQVNKSNSFDRRRRLAFSIRAQAHAGEGFSLTHVSYVVRHLLGSFTQPLYPPKQRDSNISMEDISASLSMSQVNSQAPLTTDTDEPKRDVCRDLFLWAIVQNNKEMAEIAWEQCKDCMSAALAATKILKKMAQEGSDADEAEEMLKLADHYEKHAIGVFSECHNSDEERTKKLLVRVSPVWGSTTCLRLALEADDKTFIALTGVQALLTQIWCGELSVYNSVWRVLACMVFFPLIYTGFLVFRRDEVIQRETEKHEEIKTMEKVTGSTIYTNSVGHSSHLKPLNGWSKLFYLYSSPQEVPSGSEVLLYIWLASLVCEEIRQLFHDPDGFGFKKKAQMYINDLWNILDVLSIGIFIVGLVFRLTTVLFYAGKILLCIDFVVFCLRLMAIFTISRTLGPKIIIVKRMMMDLFFFMFLLSIWVVAYGVAKQGILIHNDNRLDWIVLAHHHHALYLLLFANILLLNLLIAIFNFTFQEVQDNTDRIWKFQRYELIKEYHSRPTAPPPFIILSHFYLFVKKMVLCRPSVASKKFKIKLPVNEEEELLSWEALMKDRYLLSTQQEQSQSMERRIMDTANKVTTINDRLEREEETSSDPVVKRLARLEEQVAQSAKALQWIMDSLKSQGFGAKEAQSLTSSTTDESPDTYASTSEKEDGFHVKARQFHYPGSKLTRFPVPEEKVPWETSFSSYKPTYYPSEDQVDGSESEDLDKYRNPKGRTGIRGRGALRQLGPNMSVDLVITRWRDGKPPVLEYLEVSGESQGAFSLPGGFVEATDNLPKDLERTMGRTLYKKLNEKLSDGEKAFQGYVDDARNTDNAWVETTALNIHLDRGSQIMEDIEKKLMKNQGHLQWQEVSSKTRLNSNQRDFLRRVAIGHNRKF
ncbi:hypothetical protein D5F01_LYC01805 [Larimichthys crocea]|uniref:Transient receptor potential cation channel subfamily M member 2 n=1 Tax=Larimichthys crocea TaxID=215358 RepID=A0A6G0J6S3_LARCR|nr:hypothetical protein D5F01_LYC01805 [Larimichthys crocea]